MSNGLQFTPDVGGRNERNMELSAEDYNYWHMILSRPVTKAKSRAFMREFLAGLTVALAQVPEAVAFSFTANVDPIIGLQAAWIVCFITGVFGGAPGMISGATGALAVVLPTFVKENGVGYLFIAVLMMGWLQILFGLIGAGRLIRLVGQPVMIGFCNGLAIVIGIAQLHSFKQKVENEDTGEQEEVYFKGATLYWQLFLVVVTMAVIYLLPKLSKVIPSSLAGILVGAAFEFALIRPLGFETPTVGDLASVKGFFPIPVWIDDRYANVTIPPLSEAETWRTCMPIALTLAIIGLVESLMTLQLVSEITEKPSSATRECFAQGFANVVTGMFGGMGGCAMIGQSMINVKSGGVTRISSVTAGLFLLLVLLVAYPVINLIPVASLAGVMFMVVIATFEWYTFKILFATMLPEKYRNHPKVNNLQKVKRTDALIIVLVTLVAIFANLAYAVGAGVVLSALVFAWDQGSTLRVASVPYSLDSEGGEEENYRDDGDGKIKVYKISGPLFFASGQAFTKNFDYENDPKIVELHFDRGALCDYTALAAINAVARRYKAKSKELRLRRVEPKSMRAIRKAHHLMFVYDKEADVQSNEYELLSMQDLPNWHSDAAHIRAHDNEQVFVGEIEEENLQSNSFFGNRSGAIAERSDDADDSSASDSVNLNVNDVIGQDSKTGKQERDVAVV